MKKIYLSIVLALLTSASQAAIIATYINGAGTNAGAEATTNRATVPSFLGAGASVSNGTLVGVSGRASNSYAGSFPMVAGNAGNNWIGSSTNTLNGGANYTEAQLLSMSGATVNSRSGMSFTVAGSDLAQVDFSTLTFDLIVATNTGATTINVSYALYANTGSGYVCVGSGATGTTNVPAKAQSPDCVYADCGTRTIALTTNSFATSSVTFKLIIADNSDSTSNYVAISNVNLNGGPVPVPEPTTATLSLLGLGALVLRRRRK